MNEPAREAYENGRWCGECRYGVVEDPPCCYTGADLAAPVSESQQ